MPLYASKGEFLQAALERLIDAIEEYDKHVYRNDYLAHRNLEDEIERAKKAITEADHYDRPGEE